MDTTTLDRSNLVPENVAVQAGRTAGTIAAYVQQHDWQEMLDDVHRLVRAYPEHSLVVAASAGLLLGTAFRRRNSS